MISLPKHYFPHKDVYTDDSCVDTDFSDGEESDTEKDTTKSGDSGLEDKEQFISSTRKLIAKPGHKSRIRSLNVGQTDIQSVESRVFKKVPKTKAPPPPPPEPLTILEMQQLQRKLWLTLVSCPTAITAEAVESHFETDHHPETLPPLLKRMGYRKTETLLRSKFCEKFVNVELFKDELDSTTRYVFRPCMYKDIEHITNCICESELLEDQKAQRKKFLREAQYCLPEFQETALKIREQIVDVAHKLVTESGNDTTTWSEVQTRFEKDYGEQLTRKYLRTAFPTGQASRVLEVYLSEEFEATICYEKTGNLVLKFKKSYEELMAMYAEAREKRTNCKAETVIKAPEFRTEKNHYVNYVRERQKREIYRGKTSTVKAADENTPNSLEPADPKTVQIFDSEYLKEVVKDSKSETAEDDFAKFVREQEELKIKRGKANANFNKAADENTPITVPDDPPPAVECKKLPKTTKVRFSDPDEPEDSGKFKVLGFHSDEERPSSMKEPPMTKARTKRSKTCAPSRRAPRGLHIPDIDLDDSDAESVSDFP